MKNRLEQNYYKQDKKVNSGNLRKVGLKVTQPRKRILDLLDEAGNKHVTADDIYRVLMKAGDDIGLATVYRVLNQFEAAGLVVKHNFEGGQAYYELDSGEHHDHMVCVETGTVIEFSNHEIERLQAEIAEKHGYDIVDHSLVIYVRPKNA
jgi:Fur family ferric uptake transcriptional regulator